MHFEFLVEDPSGKTMLEGLVPRILGEADTFRIHSYRGIGRIPKGLAPTSDASKRILLDQLPRLLGGYGNVFRAYPPGHGAVVIVVCDLDDRDSTVFGAQLQSILKKVDPRPPTEFCFAIEEGEAWFLGDAQAVREAYPKAKPAILGSYVPDSICGTWEVLADAVHPGGAAALGAHGYQAVGEAKSRWAVAITPKLDFGRNRSPSFKNFVAVVGRLAGKSRSPE